MAPMTRLIATVSSFVLVLVAYLALWPAIGLASWALCTGSGLDILEPFLTAGLLGHYWLDGRIWTARARRLAG